MAALPPFFARLLRRNWFLIGILAALISGLLMSGAGQKLNPRSVTTTAIVVVLFLISGLTLPTEGITHGLRQIRLHLFVQSFIFGVIPLYFLFTTSALSGVLSMERGLVTGMLALSCLPTTVSSCIVFTQSSKGNVAGTMFNASAANMAGVVISPLILSLLLGSSGGGLPPDEVVRVLVSLALKMLLPILVGQVLRIKVREWIDRRRKRLGIASNMLILLIVFFAVSKAAGNRDFLGRLAGMPLPILYLAVSHILLVLLAYGGARALRLDRASTASVLYTAPQKTLAVGAPLLTTYFAHDPATLGLALIPLLFYHPWQLVVAGFIRSSPLLRRGSSAA